MPDAKNVLKQKLTPQSKIKFRCHPGIACFTRCCSNIDILLTPYDVIRMRKRLGMTSTEFLARHTRSEIDKRTSHPLLFLKMSDNEQRTCPFVKEVKGCTIYSDRPAACRYYPVGQGTHRRMDDKNEEPVNDEFYVIVKEEHCLGFEEDKEWTIDEWRQDQEASHYDEINRDWKNMMVKTLQPGDTIDPRKQQVFYMASYDIDRFRRFVTESRFLDVIEVDPELLEKMKEDDIELMRYALEYVKHTNGVPNTVRVKQEVIQEHLSRVQPRPPAPQDEDGD